MNEPALTFARSARARTAVEIAGAGRERGRALDDARAAASFDERRGGLRLSEERRTSGREIYSGGGTRTHNLTVNSRSLCH
jgi:hypothetical protein